MKRGYQYGFSDQNTPMFDVDGRKRKARTMVAVLTDYFKKRVNDLSLLNVGGSTGIIDNYLSDYFPHVVSIDIDEKAISYAQKKYQKKNLVCEIGDAMNLKYESATFDVVICAHVYEHVPNADVMMSEILRVLKPDGVCYFAAGNRLMWNEPHYQLPLLSVIPRSMAHFYLRATKKGSIYYEKHLSYWGLKKLVSHFEIKDYTPDIIFCPKKYHAEYMIQPGTTKARIARIIATYFIWLVPSYIWILKKRSKGQSN